MWEKKRLDFSNMSSLYLKYLKWLWLLHCLHGYKRGTLSMQEKIYLQLGTIPLSPELVHDGVGLLHYNLHLVILVCHLFHLLYGLLETLLHMFILCFQVHYFVFCPLQKEIVSP